MFFVGVKLPVMSFSVTTFLPIPTLTRRMVGSGVTIRAMKVRLAMNTLPGWATA